MRYPAAASQNDRPTFGIAAPNQQSAGENSRFGGRPPPNGFTGMVPGSLTGPPSRGYEERQNSNPSPQLLQESSHYLAYRANRLPSSDSDIIRRSYEQDSEQDSNNSEDDDSILEIDLNDRFRLMPDRTRPVWHRKENGCEHTTQKGSMEYLCATCRRIDFIEILNQDETEITPPPSDCIVLGPLDGIIQKKKDCGLCSLISRMVVLEILKDVSGNMDEEERSRFLMEEIAPQLRDLYYIYPVRFKSQYRVPVFYLGRNIWNNRNSVIMPNSVAILPERSLAMRPFHQNQLNLGRITKKDRIDIEWVKERLALCDERSVRPPYRLRAVLRAIDVNRLCITDLANGARYVTLSYTWGTAKQFLLTREVENIVFQPGGLTPFLNQIPKTIRDAIRLVREIGERFLWVDALCIIQDDERDRNQQIGMMGDIYHEGVLTIQACCGSDASYGLPGVEPGSRSIKQVVEKVGHLAMGNMLPDIESGHHSVWSTRAWTFQEKVLSRRMLVISDEVVFWWCWHTCTPEDEHCRHTAWPEGQEDQDMMFFTTEHDRVISKRGSLSNFDLYAFVISDYSNRNMTVQADAERALLGIFERLAGHFRGSFIHGLPDTELDSALLWCPLGSSERRVDPETGEPLFPSWSWLGWVGHAAYPWAVERSFPCSTIQSPLLWRDAGVESTEDSWFTGDQYRLCDLFPEHAKSTSRWSEDPADAWCFLDAFAPPHYWLNPVIQVPQGNRLFQFLSHNSHQLRFRTLSAHLRLAEQVQRRKDNYNHLHEVYQIRVLDSRGFGAGYVYVEDPDKMGAEQRARFTGRREFIVLSRASVNPNPRVGQDFLHEDLGASSASMGMPQMFSSGLHSEDPNYCLDRLAYFDKSVYYTTNPWCLFNVMMIERRGKIAYRVTVGRVHVGAFMFENPSEQEIWLE
jgi:hypothetical protein